MKAKTLRRKDTHEYIVIMEVNGFNVRYTSELPYLQPMTATIELMKNYYQDPEINFDDLELIELDININEN
jgi:hypothetical protein